MNKVDFHECEHTNTDTESIDYGQPNAEIGDYVDDWRDTLVCQDCDAIYNEYDSEWVL
jgi:hypothetical protein